jgi:hypothetical protein
VTALTGVIPCAAVLLVSGNAWNDPILAKANPGVVFPAADIVVVHRSDGSSTTVKLRGQECRV